MRLIPEIVRRGMAFYRMHGFRKLVKAALTYLWNEYHVRRHRYSLSLKTRPIGQGRKIFYIDHFRLGGSALHWLKAFQKFGKVETFDIAGENQASFRERIMSYKPVHIYLGGGVKDNMVSPQLLSNIKRELNCTISVFYGDAKYSSYHCRLAKVTDYIYISNKTHIKINEEKGYHNFRYMPCPTDPEIFNYEKCRKRYDLVFIGNNNQPERLPLLKSLASSFDLRVFGNGWEGTGLNYRKPVYGARFSQACNRAKICLAIVEPRHANLEAYFSNRLVNSLATRSFCIESYTPGLEKVFTNHKHLVWYTSQEELFQLIEHYLGNEAEREQIATEGQKEVYHKYTYEKGVKRILKDAEEMKAGPFLEPRLKRSKLGQDWQDILSRESKKGGERFTIEWYRDHIITKELLRSGILQGEVIDLGCGIGTRAFLAQEEIEVRISGIDGSQYAISYATNSFKSSRLNFLCGDLLKIPFETGTFDNACMLAVIEHIADTNTLLSEIKRVVKPRGKLFLSVTEKDYHSDPSHVHVFTKSSLREILKEFKILNLYVKAHIIFAVIEV